MIDLGTWQAFRDQGLEAVGAVSEMLTLRLAGSS